MAFLSPLSLTFGLLALPILLLYMLKLRRKQVEVSSTLLWQMLMRDRQANSPWQRLKRNLLLFLQLLILAALVFSLARPALPIPSIASGSVIVLVDASASMNAQDENPSRFEVARQEARRLIASLPSSSHVTTILVGRTPHILTSAETDKTRIYRLLDEAQPELGPAGWKAAFALAAGAAATSPGAQDEENTIVILSDGGLPSEGLPPLPGVVRYVPIGSAADNLAISALAVRQACTDRSICDTAQLLARLANYGITKAGAVVSFYKNGEFLNAQEVTLEPGQDLPIVLAELPNEEGIYQARLSPLVSSDSAGSSISRLDSLALDDSAYAIYRPSTGGRALLVSQGNLFLEQVLAAMDTVTPFKALPGEDGQIRLPAEPFDLYIFDGIVPEELPASNLLLVNPPSNPLFSVNGVFSDTFNLEVLDHPLTSFVDISDLHVSKARQVQLPPWAEVLIRSEGGPLVFAGESGSRQLAVIAFDLHDSDLPLRIAFPILFSNLIDFLAPARAFDASQSLLPGDSLLIRPRATTTQATVTDPNGIVYRLSPTEGGISFSQTSDLGIYQVTYIEGDTRSSEYFAVNLFDQEESTLLPAGEIQVGHASISPSRQSEIGQREIWPLLAGAALSLLVLEWWVYHRRLNLPLNWWKKIRQALPVRF